MLVVNKLYQIIAGDYQQLQQGIATKLEINLGTRSLKLWCQHHDGGGDTEIDNTIHLADALVCCFPNKLNKFKNKHILPYGEGICFHQIMIHNNTVWIKFWTE